MPNLRLSDKLMFSTVKITCILADNKTSRGTGFIFAKDNSLAIVTNQHVIENSVTGRFS
jgi:S1-C subfamily serine protease